MKLLSTVVLSSALFATVPALACNGSICAPVVEKGHFEVRKTRVQTPGRWAYETQQVTVPGRWANTTQRVMVSPGHYENRTRTVTVPGRWVSDPCACRSTRRQRRRHRNRSFTINFGRGGVQFGGHRHRCAPVKRWIPPTCKQISEKVWVNPVYQNRTVRTWIQPQVCSKQVKVWKPGCWEIRRERVWVAPKLTFACS